MGGTLWGVSVANLIFYAVCTIGLIMAFVLQYSKFNQVKDSEKIIINDRTFEGNNTEPSWWNTRR